MVMRSPDRLESRTGSPSCSRLTNWVMTELQLVGIMAEGLHRGLHPRDVAVVVGAPAR